MYKLNDEESPLKIKNNIFKHSNIYDKSVNSHKFVFLTKFYPRYK